MTTSTKTIYGEAKVQQMPADEDGDVGYCVMSSGGAKLGGVQWSREAAERDLVSMHAHYLREQERPRISASDLAAADYFSGDESVVGAGPEKRHG